MINRSNTPLPDQEIQGDAQDHIPSRNSPVNTTTLTPRQQPDPWLRPPSFARGVTSRCPYHPEGRGWHFLSRMTLRLTDEHGLAYVCSEHESMGRPVRRPIGGPVRINPPPKPTVSQMIFGGIGEPQAAPDPWARRDPRGELPPYGCDGDPCTKIHHHPTDDEFLSAEPRPEPSAGGFLARFFKGRI